MQFSYARKFQSIQRKIVLLHITKKQEVVQVLDKSFEMFITADEIQQEIASLGAQITQDYEGKELIFLSVLNGAFMFTSDLMKKINLECEVSFVKVSSYSGTSSRGHVDELIGLNTDLKDKHVIIIEDIVDTGVTIGKIRHLLKEKDTASIAVCTCLYKPAAYNGEIQPEYVGFSIPNAFVVGYGLDYNEKSRNLDSIYQIRQTNTEN